MVLVLLVLVGGLSFAVGAMWSKLKSPAAATIATATAQPAQPAAPTVSANDIKAIFANDKNIILGDKNSKLLFVEVADPSCPYCHVAAGHNPTLATQMGPNFKPVSDGGTYQPPVIEMKKLVDAGKAAFAYIYFPGHGNGEMGAKALYCAQEKGKFWDVHDKLMSNGGYDLMNTDVKNDKTKSGTVATFLSGIIDSSFMKTCLDSGKYDTKLTEDQALAGKLGVNGTPGFFINTTNFAGAYSWKDMVAATKTSI